MKDDPKYLRNESRYNHALNRRLRRQLNWVSLFACLFGLVLAIGSVFSRGLELGSGLAFVALAGFFWLFGRLILSVHLGSIRRLYGPEPGGPPE
jgi:hypothetical protein